MFECTTLADGKRLALNGEPITVHIILEPPDRDDKSRYVNESGIV